MDISKQLESVITSIVENVQSKVTLQIGDIVKAHLRTEMERLDYSKIIAEVAATQVAAKVADLEFDADAVNAQINRATTALVDTISKKTTEDIGLLVDKKINAVDFESQLSRTLGSVIDQKLTTFAFPVNSIPFNSINMTDAVISGDHIAGGIIRHFGSAGIDDKSTACAITILDTAVVVENNLVTMDLTIQGNLEVNGHVDQNSQFYQNLSQSISAKVHGELDEGFFKNYSDIIFNQIKRDGLDLGKITVDGSTVIEGNRIGTGITESNLQKLGLLKELQVEGETAIAGTFYVGNKRVGVNTLEPSAALAVWDAEVEITVNKLKENVGMITTPRAQTLVLGSNRNQNIVLNIDGTTQIDNLQIGFTRFGSSETPPNFDSIKGHTVFNANPSPGGPMGWVCLGGPNWANFGIID